MPPEFVPPPDALTVPARDTNLDPDSTRSGDHQGEGAPVDPWATVTPGAAGAPRFSSGSPVLPCRFGSYLLEEEIAAGGMGVVYKAQQVLGEGDPPRTRRVALKMILPEKLRSGDAVGRFEDEAHFAANLEHPHIVPIYEVGKIDGQPFFSMQYVEGGNLEQVVDDPQPVRPRLAARLVQQLAEAVQYAHDRGVVHRDIKPSNILLSQGGGTSQEADLDLPDSDSVRLVPKLSDFGLARTADSSRTLTGEVMGTPSFMPPEQALGELERVGPRSDVYALGAVLYALLCGRPPFAAGDPRKTIAAVVGDDVEPPRRTDRGRATPRDLETVCLKCLEKDPQRRYGTARDLADELGRFLRDEPVLARRPSRLERLVRKVGRHRREVLLATLAIVAALSLLALLLRHGAQQRAQAQRQRQDYLDATLRLEQVKEHLEGGDPQELPQRLRELESAWEHVRQPSSDPELSLRAAEASAGVAEELRLRGHKREAALAGQAARHLLVEMDRADPPREIGDRVAFTRALVGLTLGQVLVDGRDYDDATGEYEDARGTLERLGRAGPGDLDECLRKQAEAWHLLGELNAARNDQSRALRCYRESIGLRDRLASGRGDREPADRLHWRDLARGHGYLGDVHLDRGDLDAAERAYAQAQAIRDRLVRARPDDAEALWQQARSYTNTGFLCQGRGDLSAAVRAFEQARTVQRGLVQRYRARAEYRSDLGWTTLEIVETSLDRGDPPASLLPLLDELIPLFEDMREDSRETKNHTKHLARSHLARAACLPSGAAATRCLDTARDLLEELIEDDRRQNRPWNPEDLYQQAVVLALRAREAGSEASARLLAEEALTMLGTAVVAGYRDAERMKRDARLGRLRDLAPMPLHRTVERCLAKRNGR